MALNIVLLLTFAFQLVRAQWDPILNFCRRLDQQSTIIDGSLWIDGGREVYTSYEAAGNDNGTAKTLGINNKLVVIDVSVSWDYNNVLPTRSVPKLKDTAGNDIPDVSNGALYPDPNNPDKFWLFGGTTAQDNPSFEAYQLPQPGWSALWSYDNSSNEWTGFDTTPFGINRPFSGATASVSDQGLGFWFNGLQDNGSAVETKGLGDNFRFLDGMVVLDLSNRSAKNISTTAVSNQARARGQMVHVPLRGSNGVLVLVGGGQKSSSTMDNDWKGTLVPMDTIDIFDLDSLEDPKTPNGKWYKQKTSGQAPLPRIDFCLTVVNAPDKSSQNIYMYGGRDGESQYFDETWVLTLPSFQWQLVTSGNSPRYSMSCHVIGNRHMITIGGADDTDISATCDSESKGVGVLEMSTLTWQTTYNASAEAYTVPPIIVSLIGGTENGNATKTAPSAGWGDPQLKNLFNPSALVTGSGSGGSGSTNSDGTPAQVKKKTSGGAIAIIVIGIAIGVGALVAVVLFYRRKNQKQQAEQQLSQEGHGQPIYNAAGHNGAADSKNDFSVHEKPIEMYTGKGKEYASSITLPRKGSAEKPREVI